MCFNEVCVSIFVFIFIGHILFEEILSFVTAGSLSFNLHLFGIADKICFHLIQEIPFSSQYFMLLGSPALSLVWGVDLEEEGIPQEFENH